MYHIDAHCCSCSSENLALRHFFVIFSREMWSGNIGHSLPQLHFTIFTNDESLTGVLAARGTKNKWLNRADEL